MKEKILTKKCDVYKETIEILFNQNQLKHYSQFLDVKQNIYNACNREDTKLVGGFTLDYIITNNLIKICCIMNNNEKFKL